MQCLLPTKTQVLTDRRPFIYEGRKRDATFYPPVFGRSALFPGANLYSHTPTEARHGSLFHRHGFGQIARLVHVGAALQGGVIGQEWHRDGMHDGRENAHMPRRADNVDACTF